MATERYNSAMSGKYQIRKMRRDGVTQRYWVNPSREHDDAVTAVIGGDLATAESRKEQKLARKLMQTPSVQESLYRSLVRKYENAVPSDVGPVWFMQNYLAHGYPEAEALLVRLATEPSDGNVRTAAIHTIATSMDPRAPRLLREIADKAPDEWTARTAIVDLAAYLDITMVNLVSEGITPTREAVLDALETLGLALQGEWFRPAGEIDSILYSLKYNRSEFERAVQGQIPDSVEKQVIDGLMSVLPMGGLPTEMFEQTLNVIKEWGSEYALRKLRSYLRGAISLLRGAISQQRRQMVLDAINEIEHQLKRNSG
jgi:hypothetical protein